MLIVVAEVCVALFQRSLPAPGSPEVALVFASYPNAVVEPPANA